MKTPEERQYLLMSHLSEVFLVDTNISEFVSTFIFP